MKTALTPAIKGIVWGLIAFGVGAGITLGVRAWTGVEPLGMDAVLTFGYAFGIVGWLMGVGVWDVWGREWFGLPVKKNDIPGWQRYFTFNSDHKVIGVQYLVTFIVVFLLAGSLAMLIRTELMAPGKTIMTAPEYNTTMSLHGILMIAVAVATVLGGFGNYAVPLMIGARDMAFPRLNALSYWLVPPVAVLLLATPFAGGLDTGWTAYAPLSEVNAPAQVLFNLAIITFGLSSIFGGLNFLVTIATMRAPGMGWGKIPIFVWSIFAASILSLTFTQFFAAALLMILLDRVFGMTFFARGGDPLLYQHVFWFYSHPAVYVMIIPGFGLALEMLTHFARKPLFAYKWAVGGFMGVVALSGVVWAHHMFSSGMPEWLHAPIMALTELISIPTGFVFLAALGTIWMGRLWLTTPMLFALSFIFNFLIGGLTGIFLADVPTDIHLTDTYFVVSHFHYTIVGGEIFALFGALYYWFPKITGRMYDEKLGKLHFWWMFLAYNLTFIPMFGVGINGMNRRIADYPSVYANDNLLISLAAFGLGASFLVFVWNILRSVLRGPKAAANPWQARTLEWQVSSPPPHENFERIPVVTGHPYDYGVEGSVHAQVGV